MLQPPHTEQDIYAELRLASWLEIHISFSSIIYYMYRYTVNIDYSSLVYLTYYLRAKVVIPNVIFRYLSIQNPRGESRNLFQTFRFIQTFFLLIRG